MKFFRTCRKDFAKVVSFARKTDRTFIEFHARNFKPGIARRSKKISHAAAQI
jgi:hypothetical protein